MNLPGFSIIKQKNHSYLKEVHVKLFKLIYLENAVQIASVALSQTDQRAYADLVQLQALLLRTLHVGADQTLEIPEIPLLRRRLQQIIVGRRFRNGNRLRFALTQLFVEEPLSILQSTVVLLEEQPSADHQTCTPFAICAKRKERRLV